MMTRRLGRSGIEVSALGMGCWAIGGPFTRDGEPVGWGEVDDDESLRAIQRALDLGITFFDTADVYGCGHSERLLARAFAGKRDQVVIATKFGHVFDKERKDIYAADGSPQYVRRCCEASLQRLNTDYIDLYQFHVGEYHPEKAVATREALEELIAEGKIRAYGWSTDHPDRARVFAEGPHCATIQQQLNILEGNAQTLAVCEELGLASINRGPLAKGLLTGKFTADSKLPDNDVRHDWNFKEGEQAEWLKKLDAIRLVLTRDGRTLAQAAIGWLWARSGVTIPIPGFKTVAQVEENIGSLQFGPLSQEQMKQIDQILAR